MRSGLQLVLLLSSLVFGGQTGASDSVLQRTRETTEECLIRLKRADIAKSHPPPPTTKPDGPQHSPFTFTKVEAQSLPMDCRSGDLEQVKRAFKRQIASCLRNRDREALSIQQIGCRNYSRKEWCLDVSEKMLMLANESRDFSALMDHATSMFEWYKSGGRLEDDSLGRIKKGETQFTAYYSAPPIEARLEKSKDFPFPLYRTPSGLEHFLLSDPRDCGTDPVTSLKIKWCRKMKDGSLTPLPTRKEIDQDLALAGQGLEIAYVKDPLAIAFLMVEGSGSLHVIAKDGREHTVRINFDAQNGRSRNMLSRIIRCEGGTADDYSSEIGIRRYLEKNPDTYFTTLNFDQSYVFFKEDSAGPLGADDIPLTPRHSIAVDRTVIPMGAVALFQTNSPQVKTGVALNDVKNCPHLTSLAVAQDSGGAITGAHVDWYMGEGAMAQDLANAVNFPGALYLALLPGTGSAIAGCK